jgi:tetratricopeptide (TPR) repeat protein
VLASPPSATYRLRKLARRHRVGAAATIAAVAATAVGLAGTSLGLLRALRAERVADAERAAAVAEAEKANAVVEFLVDVLASPDPRRAGREVRVVDVLEGVSARYDERFASAPDVRARLALALGGVYDGLGIEQEGGEQLERALATLRALHDGPHASTVDAARLLAVHETLVGRLDEAERLLDGARAEQAALDVDGATPADDARRSRLAVATGRLLLAQNRLEDAERELRAGLEGLDRTLGTEHREALIARNTLAGLLHESGRLEDAEPLYRAALAGLTAQLGDEHPDTVRLRFNYAMLLHTRGETERSIDQMRVLLTVRERTLGDDHPDTLAVLANLGAMELLRGNLEEADLLCRAVLARAPQGPEHPLTQTMKVNLGNVRYRLGDFAEAEALWGDVYEQRARTFGEDHEHAPRPLFDLARAARGLQEYESALERARRGLEASRRTLGERHRFTFEFERELGRTLVLLDRYDEAEEVLLASLALHRDLAGEVDGLQGPEPQLAALYDAWGRPDDADRYRGSGSTGEPPN